MMHIEKVEGVLTKNGQKSPFTCTIKSRKFEAGQVFENETSYFCVKKTDNKGLYFYFYSKRLCDFVKRKDKAQAIPVKTNCSFKYFQDFIVKNSLQHMPQHFGKLPIYK